MLAEVKISAEIATAVKNEVQIVKDKAMKIVQAIQAEKAVAEVKLKAAEPALAEAEAALNVRFVKNVFERVPHPENGCMKPYNLSSLI